MAPNPNKTSKLSSEELSKIALPNRFKCRQCTEFKIPASFSNKEIRTFQFKKSHIPNINGVSAKLRCISCAGEQLHELQCEGQCGMVKPLDCFSKSQRTRGLKWCQECILWKEAAEPGVILAAAPGTDLAPDENDEGDGWGYNSDPEIGSDSEDESEYQFTPWQAIAGLKLAGKSSGSLATVATSASAQGLAKVHLNATQPTRHLPNRPAGEPSGVHTGTLTTTQSGYVPPHIRAANRGSSGATCETQPQSKKIIDVDIDAKTESYASNPYEDAWSSNDTLGPWSAVDTRRRNALYEPQRSVQEVTPPAPIQAPAGPSTRGNWVKSVGVRMPRPQFPQTITPHQSRRRDYDSDDSQDEM